MVGTHRAREVDQNFRETIERVLRCISGDGLFVAPVPTGSPRLSWLLGFQGDRSRLKVAGGGRLFLHVGHEYTIEEDPPGQPRVTTLEYIYTIYDADEQRILGYHYHPRSREEAPLPTPHLHVYTNTYLAGRYLPKLHLPTSRVALEDVVSLLIEGFGVEPRLGYDEEDKRTGEKRWRKDIREAREIFTALRRWA